MSVISYLRVSTADQSIENQRALISKSYAIDDEFTDEAVSGATTAASRNGWQECLRYLRKGDVLVVVAIDRLGRSAVDVLSTVEQLQARGVSIVSLREGFDLSTPVGKMMLTMMAGFAQMERSVMAERREAGMARARAEGKHMGRPRVTSTEAIRAALTKHEGNVSAVARELSCSRATVIRARDA